MREVLDARARRVHGHRRRLDEGRPSARPRAATRASSAATRSAAPRRAGPSARRAELFDGATWFLTPTAATAPERLPARARLRHRARRPAGRDRPGRPRPARRGDEPPAARARERPPQPGRARRGSTGTTRCRRPGGSLRDMTRIAGANPRIWVDIFLDNREALAAALAEHRRRVEQLERALAAGDAGFLARWIGEAARQPPADARRRPTPTRARSSGCASTSPTGRACSPGSSRRSAPSGSTSRTSSSTTSRPSAAAR